MDTHYGPIIGPKLRQAFKKMNIKTIFISCPNLNHSYAETKQSCYLTVIREYASTYFGETKKKILARTLEHQQDSFKGKWDNSGATEHSLTCHGQFN